MRLKTAHLGLFLAFALILSYVESLIPFYFGIPGMKLGLANLIIVLLLYLYDYKTALLINIFRIILVSFLFGNMYGLLYSMAGAILSFTAMDIGKKTGLFSISGVSILGGVFHNIGQIFIAMYVVETYSILYYLPFLLIAGVITGMCIGMLAKLLNGRLRDILQMNKESQHDSIYKG